MLGCLRKFLHNIQVIAVPRNKFYTKLACKNTLHKIRYIIPRFVHNTSDDKTHVGDIEKGEINIYQELANKYLNSSIAGHRVFVLQPFVKWGPKKKMNTTAQLQLDEAVALINTLSRWTVADTMCISLKKLQLKQLLGPGQLTELRKRILTCGNVTALFVSVNILRHIQVTELENILGIPVYDRYLIVMHIFREHAITSEAKLQVALAEIPYIKRRMRDTDDMLSGAINADEKRRLYLHKYESKLQMKLEKLKEHRELLRNNRRNQEIPSIAVVGYTNAGKTCLIKALTEDTALEPKNVLFATLDTTIHGGFLPCRLQVVYVDTIGFIQDVPESLIEPFKVTLEDAIIADIVVHVYDISHPDYKAQYEHVTKTIMPMITRTQPIIHVANKCDLVKPEKIPNGAFPVSALEFTGINTLRLKIQEIILRTTGRTIKRIRVQSGSPAAAWLYKETTVINTEVDPDNTQCLYYDVIVTEQDLYKFRRYLKQ